MTPFKLSDELIEQIEALIEVDNKHELLMLLGDVHYADIAEIIHELNLDEATYLIKLLDSKKTSDVITELDEDIRDKILEKLSAKEIADEIVELDTDDAADIINELPDDRRDEVIAFIDDHEHAKDIVELLRYDNDTAGGLMAKELVKVNENWSVLNCVKEMRAQAEHVTRVHSIYVVDDNERLIGRLSLKDLLTASTRSAIKDIYISKVDYASVHDDAEDVARIMAKYDLEAIPVVDELGRLVGRITIDDIVDVIRDEAERDYQMAAGISKDVEAKDSILKLTRARLPWLLIGTFGGMMAAKIITSFQQGMGDFVILLSFVPLIQATAGNVGVQSSAIVVQGLANNSIDGQIINRLFKEFLLGLVNGGSIALIVLLITHFFFNTDYIVSLTIGIAIISVIIIAAIIGTFIPIFLDKRGIDPAVATGPFITTSNDIFGILVYFSIAKLILGF
ncbi:magnesium transporter [Neptunitalea lumnitzerae]|uniref:Magnesium transporter MgtE n=1 Tax=Neptunitalea lumnitzerae TaxID=2965509 RepID=A0ABQ5MGG1_9FLAO|nr:magnesium transporter [Neptunitalea sp. Y10]GLB48386.1 magnesium transporter MgtE [Neptunitalea sp. Y10]